MASKQQLFKLHHPEPTSDGSWWIQLAWVGGVAAIVLGLVYFFLIRPWQNRKCTPKFLGHFYLFPQDGVEVNQVPEENKKDVFNGPEVIGFAELEPAMVHALTKDGMHLTVDTMEESLADIASTIRQECLSPKLTIFGLNGMNRQTAVFIPRMDVPWDVYGQAPEAAPHTVAVFSMPKHWFCW